MNKHAPRKLLFNMSNAQTACYDEFDAIRAKDAELLCPRVSDLNIHQCPFCYEMNILGQFSWLFVYNSDKPHMGLKHCFAEKCVQNAKYSLVKCLIDRMQLPFQCTFQETFNSDKHEKCCLQMIFYDLKKEKVYLKFTSTFDNTIFYRTVEDFEKVNPGKYAKIINSIKYPEFYPETLKKVFTG